MKIRQTLFILAKLFFDKTGNTSALFKPIIIIEMIPFFAIFAGFQILVIIRAKSAALLIAPTSYVMYLFTIAIMLSKE